MRTYRTIALFIAWVLVITSFCTVHLTGDFECFIAWARSTHQNDVSGISSLSETWELKGVLLRAIYLALYNLSIFFADDVTLKFQFVFKLFGAVLLNALLALAVYLFPHKYLGNKLNRKEWFFILGILLFSVHFASHLQAEFIAVIILILATSLYLRDGILMKIISGIIVGITFFLKSPIPIMGGSLMFISMLYTKRSFLKEFVNILPLGISMVLTVSLGLSGLYLFSPQEIQDILDASVFQSTLLSNLSAVKFSLVKLFFAVGLNIWYNAGVGILLMLITFYLLRWRIDKTIFLLLMATVFPCIYIMLSNCYFVYHCYLLMYTALFTIWYFIAKDCKFRITGSVVVYYAAVFIISLIINPWAYHIPSSKLLLSILTICLCGMMLIEKFRRNIYHITLVFLVFSYIVNGSSISASAIRSNMEYNQFLNETKIQNASIGGSLGNECILYLDGGLGSFCLNNKSYLRYFYPLPIQRIDESGSEFVHTKTFVSVIKDINSFDKQYITLDYNWFFRYPHPDVENLLKEKYTNVQEVKLPTYSWELFCKNQLEYCSIRIMQKKINIHQ